MSTSEEVSHLQELYTIKKFMIIFIQVIPWAFPFLGAEKFDTVFWFYLLRI